MWRRSTACATSCESHGSWSRSPLTSQQVLDRYAPELAARIGSMNASPRFLIVIFAIAGVITALGYLR